VTVRRAIAACYGDDLLVKAKGNLRCLTMEEFPFLAVSLNVAWANDPPRVIAMPLALASRRGEPLVVLGEDQGRDDVPWD
jgi:hypothetical protein